MSANEPGHEPAPGRQADAAAEPPVSLGRRRALLKGLGKAGAVASAAVPLRSLATGEKNLRLPKNGKNYRCTVSAQASLLHSAMANLPPACVGNTLPHYCSTPNWPQAGGQPVCWVGGVAHACTVSLDTAMACGNISSRSSKPLTTLLNSYPTSDEAHWVVALLNAQKYSSTFPYTTSEVRDLYANASKRADAIAFFRTYMEGA